MNHCPFLRDIDVRITLILFFISLCSFIYFKHSVHDDNAVNRVALCLAILEDRSVCIDKYHHLSKDICLRDGHYYCDKAPGASFLALPFVAVAYDMLKAVGHVDFVSYDGTEKNREANVNFKLLLIAGSVAVSIITAWGVAAMYRLGRLFGATRPMALLAALLLGFGTFYGVWATVLYGHALSAAFLTIALNAGFELRNKSPLTFRQLLGWTFVGFLLAYAVLIEYPVAIASCLLGLYFVVESFHRHRTMTQTVVPAVCLILGALPVAAVFFYYNSIAFGGPFKLGYQFVSTNFPKMDEGFYGISFLNATCLWNSLFSPRQGVLWYSPFLFFSPYLAFHNIRLEQNLLLNILALIIPCYFILLNASYAYPHFRHLIPCFPFAIIPFFGVWRDMNPFARFVIDVSIAASFLFSGIAFIAPWTEAYYYSDWPLFQIIRDLCFGVSGKNLLYYAGVPPFLSLIPPILLWGVGGFLVARELQRPALESRLS